ncbi:MAG: CDP-glycerol glycerophosphotransferase family protein [Kangiellaceae bacterium]|nr:CDP-glycerol glycerophosphotransferase family protein [Kangiellaceae bacterium]
MLVVFDTVNVYYLPQYTPIIDLLKQKGHQVKLACYKNKNKKASFEDVVAKMQLECLWVADDNDALSHYIQLKPDWIIFGNAFRHVDELATNTKTAQIGHGVGPKPSYYHKSAIPKTVRFMEGSLRLETIKNLYPDDQFVQTGFSKLDPIFNQQEKGLDYSELQLDEQKPTILYAPTFNPSSLERFPNNWPEDFSDYNILIKPHTFTYTRARYKKQRDKLNCWARFANTYIASEQDLSLLPFMQNADILLSEASSTLFEFAALDKPVIVCNFFKLKWSYRGPLKYRFENRFGKDNVLYKDIGLHVNSYGQLLTAIPDQLNNPDQYRTNRLRFTEDHIGPTDGKASLRIVKFLEDSISR